MASATSVRQGSSGHHPQQQFERNQDATIYVGNLDQRVHEELLWELFIQVGPVVNVHIPRDRVSNEHQGYGFVEFRNEEDAEYSIKIMHMIKMYGKPIKVNKASQDKRSQDVGANIFVGNLDPEIDEKALQSTFSTFGNIISLKVNRDSVSGKSLCHALVGYDNFDSSDAAIQSMNGQFVHNRPIHVTYAYKRDTKGEKHGSMAERLLAANKPYAAKAPTIWNFYSPQFNTPASTFNSLVSSAPNLPPLPNRPAPPLSKPPTLPQ